MKYRLRRGYKVLWLPVFGLATALIYGFSGGFQLWLLAVPIFVVGVGLLYELLWRREGWVRFHDGSIDLRIRGWGHESAGSMVLAPNVEVPYEAIKVARLTVDDQVEIEVDQDCGPYELTRGTGLIRFKPEDPYAVLQEIEMRINAARVHH
jgi:hypothetical protein